MSLVGRRVIITPEVNKEWQGTWVVTSQWDDSLTIEIIHPKHGRGAFYKHEYTLIPLTKLEKALQ